MTQNLKAPKLRFPGFTDDWEQRKVLNEVNSIDTERASLKQKNQVNLKY